MGNEEHKTHLSSSTHTVDAAVSLLEQLGFVRNVREPQIYEARLIADHPDHVLEAWVTRYGEITGVKLRFALAQPATVDASFLTAFTALADAGFTADHHEGPSASEAIAAAIAEDRADWQRGFGRETSKLTCEQALERFLMR